ncbi:CU044_5270 family protein [Streptosporangium subroseum]|uniref:CU044_5270 family protein n=1 Tax=Streptosporangium subroseum TaxID=106412 RepID=UPI00342582C7
MDDLHEIGALLVKPEPSRDVIDRRRHQLRNAMHGSPVRRRRIGWLTGGLALTAVAAAVAVMIASGAAVPAGSPEGPPVAVRQQSARQVLLVAAATAERIPEGSGKYWHVTVTRKDDNGRVSEKRQEEYWFQRDGQTWIRGLGLKGQGRTQHFTGPQPFRLGPIEASFELLQQLPTDPAALQAALRTEIADGVRRGDIRTSAGEPSADDQDDFVFDALTCLVSQAPVSSEVRAAAFRAIASLPDVQSLGAVEGGHVLQVSLSSGQVRLVVDPETSWVRDTNFYVPLGGGRLFHMEGTASIVAEWTDHLPE